MTCMNESWHFIFLFWHIKINFTILLLLAYHFRSSKQILIVRGHKSASSIFSSRHPFAVNWIDKLKLTDCSVYCCSHAPRPNAISVVFVAKLQSDRVRLTTKTRVNSLIRLIRDVWVRSSFAVDFHYQFKVSRRNFVRKVDAAASAMSVERIASTGWS